MALLDGAPVRIGVDIGGTFTDLQIYDARTGAIVGYKTPTTPEDPSVGLMNRNQGSGGPLQFHAA